MFLNNNCLSVSGHKHPCYLTTLGGGIQGSGQASASHVAWLNRSGFIAQRERVQDAAGVFYTVVRVTDAPAGYIRVELLSEGR